jgi:hypothetical protein
MKNSLSQIISKSKNVSLQIFQLYKTNNIFTPKLKSIFSINDKNPILYSILINKKYFFIFKLILLFFFLKKKKKIIIINIL